MKRTRQVILTLVTTMLMGMVAAPVAAKSYAVESIRSDVEIRDDGSIRVSERLGYRFKGSFRFAYRDFALKPGEGLLDIEVVEDGEFYRNGSDEKPGTFQISRDGDNTRITWYYRARNENRTFELRYTMTGVVKRYPDLAEFYYQFVGDEWERPIGEVVARVRLPGTGETTDIRAWAHGPLHGRVDVRTGEEVEFRVAPLPRRTFWEGRIAFDPERVPAAISGGDSPRLDTIVAEETTWANEANLRREANRRQAERSQEERVRRDELAGKFLPVSLVLALVGPGLWFRWFQRHGRAHPVQPRTPPGAVPSDHKPAALSVLLHEQVSGGALVATLLDLADRGYLEVHEERTEKDGWFGRKKVETDFRFGATGASPDVLESYERDLLDFLVKDVGDGRQFTMSGLKKTASKRRGEFRRWFQAWTKKAKKSAEQFEFFEPNPAGAMGLNALCGGVLLIAGIVMTIMSRAPVGVPAMIGGVAQLALTAVLRRRTPDGQRLKLEWLAFQKHLKSIAKGLGPVTLQSRDWGRYMVSAIVFGMHDKVLPNLRLDAADSGAVYPVWYHGSGLSDGSMTGSLDSLATGFSSMVESVSTTMSSTSGSGGGASGGGGGGSGGGGGGAG